jgi:hypothetical protein
MTSATYNKVNSAIAIHGVQIVKGNGYHYFADIEDAPTFNANKIPSVYDGGFLRSMSLEDWIAHVNDAVSV